MTTEERWRMAQNGKLRRWQEQYLRDLYRRRIQAGERSIVTLPHVAVDADVAREQIESLP